MFNKRRPKKPKRFLIITAVVLIAIGLVKYELHQLNSPAEGTISKLKTTDNAPRNDSTEYSTLNNDYFSLLYPSEMTPDFPESKPSGSLANSFLSEKNAAQKVNASLEVYIKNLPYGGITLDSDYRSYQSQQGLYKLSNRFIQGETVDIAVRDKGSNERVAMWVHGSYLMILKFQSTDKDDIDTTFATIIKSVQWLKS